MMNGMEDEQFELGYCSDASISDAILEKAQQ